MHIHTKLHQLLTCSFVRSDWHTDSWTDTAINNTCFAQYSWSADIKVDFLIVIKVDDSWWHEKVNFSKSLLRTHRCFRRHYIRRCSAVFMSVCYCKLCPNIIVSR